MEAEMPIKVLLKIKDPEILGCNSGGVKPFMDYQRKNFSHFLVFNV